MLFPVVFDVPFSVVKGLKIGSFVVIELEDFGSSFLSGDTARDVAGAGKAA